MRIEISGHCPLCEGPATFVAEREGDLAPQWHPNWFRGGLVCTKCRSIPRERAIAYCLSKFEPNWRDKVIHECSPGGRGLSPRFRKECKTYVPSQYSTEIPFGSLHPSGWRSEDLEKQTFADESFDIVITQDVFEHLFHPAAAAREIARTLRPGGLCLMTVPVVRYWETSVRRAQMTDRGVVNLLPELFHGNPVGDGKSLVTIDWGYDIAAYLTRFSGISFIALVIDDMSMGVRDPNNVILAGRKTVFPDLGER